MVYAYFELCKAHMYTCDPENSRIDGKKFRLVPTKWRADTAAMLAENGYDLDGNKIEKE